MDENKVTVSPTQKVNTNNEIQATDFEISTTSKTVDQNIIEGCGKQESLKADVDLAITKEKSGQITERKIKFFYSAVDFQNSILVLKFQYNELQKILKQHENNKVKSGNIVAIKERRINQLSKCHNNRNTIIEGY